ncbi:hypothetical protein BGZ47_000879, partial [Haplosporangium gracile]
MTSHQRFRQGDKVEFLAVRKNKTTGELYSRITDVQRVFPGVSLFKVKGVVLYYLEDENEQEYEPKRIAHYPEDIIDIVATDPAHAHMSPPPINVPSSISPQTNSGNSSQLLSTQNLDLTVSNISLQPAPSAATSTLIRTPLRYLTSPLASPTHVIHSAASLARPMVVLSTMAADIKQLQQQIDRSTDQQSAHYQQLLAQLAYMIAQMNAMLQEQAASKEREEQMLREQAESKLREELILAKQQESIDRL